MKNNSSNKSFGPFIKKHRLNRGLSIKKLSAELDIDYSYISKIENNKTIPSEIFIRRLADLLQCDKEELLMRAGKLPEDIIQILQNNPKTAADFLRRNFLKND